MVSEKKIFEGFFPIISLWALKGPRGGANFDPRDMNGRIYGLGDQMTLLHAKYLRSGPSSFREEDFLRFSHCKSMWR